MLKELRTSVMVLILMTLVTGLAYPLAITAISAAALPRQASGSLITRDGRAVGSALIGQAFSSPTYFWGRPSATAPTPYNAAASSGSNLAPTNRALEEAVRARVEALRRADPGNAAPVPVDLVTASASGLDPDISPAAAFYQAPRVARSRGLGEDAVRALVRAHIRGRQFGVFGQPRVNVLELNLALDGLR